MQKLRVQISIHFEYKFLREDIRPDPTGILATQCFYFAAPQAEILATLYPKKT